MRDPRGGYRATSSRERMDEHSRRARRLRRLALTGVVVWALLYAAAVAGVAFVAYHFAAKWW